MRQYSKVDLLRFAKFSKENENLSSAEKLKKYDKENPEITSKQKLINLAKALKIEGLHKALTGNKLPDKNEH